jgi:hypothetical protein
MRTLLKGAIEASCIVSSTLLVWMEPADVTVNHLANQGCGSLRRLALHDCGLFHVRASG